jgi:hypothetical protein
MSISGEHTISMMMIVVTLIFAVCNSLTLVLNVLEVIDKDLFETHSTIYYMLNDTSNLLVVLNCSTTWIIYYHFSTRFRRLFLYAICGSNSTWVVRKVGVPEHAQNALSYSHNVSSRTHNFSVKHNTMLQTVHTKLGILNENDEVEISENVDGNDMEMEMSPAPRTQSLNDILDNCSEEQLLRPKITYHGSYECNGLLDEEKVESADVTPIRTQNGTAKTSCLLDAPKVCLRNGKTKC